MLIIRGLLSVVGGCLVLFLLVGCFGMWLLLVCFVLMVVSCCVACCLRCLLVWYCDLLCLIDLRVVVLIVFLLCLFLL